MHDRSDGCGLGVANVIRTFCLLVRNFSFTKGVQIIEVGLYYSILRVWFPGTAQIISKNVVIMKVEAVG